MSFFDTLKQYGLWPQQQAPSQQDNPYGLDEEMMRQARLQSLSNIGAQIMAASVRQTPQQRAETLAGFDPTGGYQQSLMNAAQMKLVGDKMRASREEDDRDKAAQAWLQQKIASMPDSQQKRNAMIYLQLGDVQKAAAELTKEEAAPEAPTMKTVRVGDKDVTYQWTRDGWEKIAEGLAFEPNQSKPPSSVQEYEYAKEQGYDGSYEDFLKMATAAKAGVALPAEMGARIGLGNEFLEEDLPNIQKDVAAGVATGPVDAMLGWAGVGRQGEIRRRIQTGLDAMLRNLTGAGMTADEMARYEARYAPSLFDTPESLKSKLDGLERDLKAIKGGAVAGKTGTMSQETTNAKKRLKYNPATGELE